MWNVHSYCPFSWTSEEVTGHRVRVTAQLREAGDLPPLPGPRSLTDRTRVNTTRPGLPTQERPTPLARGLTCWRLRT